MANFQLTTGVVYVRGWTGTVSGGTTQGADGVVGTPTYSFASDPTSGFYKGGAGQMNLSSSGTLRYIWDGTSFYIRNDSGSFKMGAADDIIIARDAANVIAQRNAANAQGVRIYNTFTDASNYERLEIQWTANSARIFTSQAGTGTARSIDIGANGSQQWRFASTGNFIALTDNAVDIGTSGANRPRDLYLAGAFKQIAGVSTAGTFGSSPIVAVAQTTANSGAVTNTINYTPAAVSRTYSLTGVVNVTAWTTPASFTVVATYKDASGNARTDTAGLIRGSTGATATAVTAIDRWYFEFPAIDIDNSATAITLSTTGTFTGTPTYNFQGTLVAVR